MSQHHTFYLAICLRKLTPTSSTSILRKMTPSYFSSAASFYLVTQKRKLHNTKISTLMLLSVQDESVSFLEQTRMILHLIRPVPEQTTRFSENTDQPRSGARSSCTARTTLPRNRRSPTCLPLPPRPPRTLPGLYQNATNNWELKTRFSKEIGVQQGLHSIQVDSVEEEES